MQLGTLVPFRIIHFGLSSSPFRRKMSSCIAQPLAWRWLDDFKKLDVALIDKIGREKVGRMKWKKLSQTRSMRRLSLQSASALFSTRLEATQFDLFLDILAFTCGGESLQDNMIHQNQVDVIVRNHFSRELFMTDHLLSLYEMRCKTIGMPSDALRQGFWNEYQNLEKHSLSSFSSSMD